MYFGPDCLLCLINKVIMLSQNITSFIVKPIVIMSCNNIVTMLGKLFWLCSLCSGRLCAVQKNTEA